MRESFLLLLLVFAPFTIVSNGQTGGCPERNYQCQLDVLGKALKADPGNPENYYNIGLVFQRSGNHAQAVESFSMYVMIPGLTPDNLADGYNNRGISHRALKRPDLAIADYSRAVELNPKKSAQFLTNRGNAHGDLKDTSKALADYDRAIALDPKYALAYAVRGSLRADLKDTDKALADYAKAIELDPVYPETYYNRGHLLSGRQEYAKALPDYDKYIGLMTGNPAYLADALMNRGIAHFYTGNPQKAVDDFTRIIELFPDNLNTYKARALVYREMKRNDLAEADERKAAGKIEKSSMEYLGEGSAAFMARKYREAITPFQTALDLEKKQPKLRKELWFVLIDNLAMAYGIAGDLKKARETLEYGISKESEYPMFYYIMANTYGEENDEPNALKYLRLAYRFKDKVIAGEKFPDPLTDDSFRNFANSAAFLKAVADMKAGK